MVIRILAVPDSLLLHEFDAVFRAVLGWDNMGFLFRVHGQEFNSSAGPHVLEPSVSSNCGPPKPSCTPAEPSISGSGKCGCWMRNPHPWETMHRYAWAVAAPHRRNIAAAPPAIG